MLNLWGLNEKVGKVLLHEIDIILLFFLNSSSLNIWWYFYIKFTLHIQIVNLQNITYYMVNVDGVCNTIITYIWFWISDKSILLLWGRWSSILCFWRRRSHQNWMVQSKSLVGDKLWHRSTCYCSRKIGRIFQHRGVIFL